MSSSKNTAEGYFKVTCVEPNFFCYSLPLFHTLFILPCPSVNVYLFKCRKKFTERRTVLTSNGMPKVLVKTVAKRTVGSH